MTTIPHPPSSSVRHLMPFEKKMLKSFAEIVRLDDAMAVHCEEVGEAECDGCPMENRNGTHCNRRFLHGMIEDIKKEMPAELRELLGDHPSHFYQPCEPTQPECGTCQGPAPFVTMSSDKLIALAETEWTNRAERKQPAYDKRSWISGWFDGYFCKPKSDMSNGSTGAGNVSKMAGKIDKSLNPIPPNTYG